MPKNALFEGSNRFWAGRKRHEVLRRGFRRLCDAIGRKPTWFEGQVRHELERLELPVDRFKAGSRTLDRFYSGDEKGERLTRAEHRTGLLIACRAVAEDTLRERITDFPEIQALSELFDQLNKHTNQSLSKIYEEHRNRMHSNTGVNSPILAAVSLIGRFLRIKDEEFLEVDTCLFDEEALENGTKAESAHFVCYHYHTRPGYIVKSFLVFHRPTKLAPFCRFNDYLEVNGLKRKRTTEGLVIPLPRALYLIGTINGGDSLKLIAIDRPHSAERSYGGLFISSGDRRELVSGRTVLVRTEAADDGEAGTGIYSQEELEEEIRPFVQDLRNRVNFVTEQDMFYQGELIDQHGMVALIDRLLSEGGKPQLTFGDGSKFNPASTTHYTFNSVLQWPGGEGS